MADGAREETLDVALTLRSAALQQAGNIPHIMLLNKADLRDNWEITDQQIMAVEQQGIDVMLTSAKTGKAVGEAFSTIARATL